MWNSGIINKVQPRHNTLDIIDLAAEISKETGKDIQIDYGSIAGGKLYTIVEMIRAEGYSAIRSGINLAETKEYLLGVLRGIEFIKSKPERA